MPEELHATSQEKSIRGLRMGKEEVKRSLLDTKTYCTTPVVKTVWNWCMDGTADWLKARVSPGSDPSTHGNVHHKGVLS